MESHCLLRRRPDSTTIEEVSLIVGYRPIQDDEYYRLKVRLRWIEGSTLGSPSSTCQRSVGKLKGLIILPNENAGMVSF